MVLIRNAPNSDRITVTKEETILEFLKEMTYCTVINEGTDAIRVEFNDTSSKSVSAKDGVLIPTNTSFTFPPNKRGRYLHLISTTNNNQQVSYAVS
jgi:hypothetical protein